MGKVRVMLDTNIVLDYFTGRMNDGLASKILQVGRSDVYEMCISFLTAVNTMYVARKVSAERVTPSVLTSLFTILPQDRQQWADAASLGISDFEDALQVSCALHNDCFIAISRDPHLDSSPLAILSPEQFIKAVCG